MISSIICIAAFLNGIKSKNNITSLNIYPNIGIEIVMVDKSNLVKLLSFLFCSIIDVKIIKFKYKITVIILTGFIVFIRDSISNFENRYISESILIKNKVAIK